MLDTPATNFDFATAADITAAVASGRASAVGVIEAALARIRERDPLLNSFTAVTEQRALLRAQAIDAARASGEPIGPLAGVPFAVKNLFDVAGLPTLAGSKINRDNPPATRDATLIERLEAAGAVLVGALNMGEYAYDFTGENIHDGASRNPHDHDRMSGGSSGGSGSAVGGGLVPLALGSDTNGSIRVPSSLCGIFGLKPTYGRLSRARSFPFVASLDHVGPLARSTHDLALAYDAMQGFDADDPACADRAAEPVVPLLERGADGLRVAVAGGYFKCKSGEACYAIDRVAAALGANRDIDIPASRTRARGGFHYHRQRRRQPASATAAQPRQRLRSGGARPAAGRRDGAGCADREGAKIPPLVSRASAGAVRRKSTPSWRRRRRAPAPLIGQQTFMHGDAELPVRANLGIYTQPISFIGLPVVAVPVPLTPLPIGVQIITAPWREDVALRLAHALETQGVVAAMRPNL